MAQEIRGVAAGTVVRGADGSLYYIRDELLAQFKMEGAALEQAEKVLESTSGGDVAGFDFRPTYESQQESIQPLAYVQGEVVPENPDDRAPQMMKRSTVMCPWFC